MVLTFGFVQRRRRDRGAVNRTVSSWVFVAGYLLTWTTFGRPPTACMWACARSRFPRCRGHRGGPYLAGGVLLAGAVYPAHASLRMLPAPLPFTA